MKQFDFYNYALRIVKVEHIFTDAREEFSELFFATIIKAFFHADLKKGNLDLELIVGGCEIL